MRNITAFATTSSNNYSDSTTTGNNINASSSNRSEWITREQQLRMRQEPIHIQLDAHLHSLSSNFQYLVKLSNSSTDSPSNTAISGDDEDTAANVTRIREQMEIELRCRNLTRSVESLLCMTREIKESIVAHHSLLTSSSPPSSP